MKRILALVTLTSAVALFAFAGHAAAQETATLTADPATVPAEGSYTFTVTGSGFIPDSSGVNVLPCTLPGETLSPASSAEEIAAAVAVLNPLGGDCDLGNVTPVSIDSDGGFSIEATASVGVNFAWGAGDVSQTQSALIPVFIVDPAMADDMADDMAPDGAAETGFGGMAGSDGNSVAVPLTAALVGASLLAGAALVARRNA